LIFLLSIANNIVNAQEDSAQHLLFSHLYSAAEKEYGIHQGLINGYLFEEENQNASGHPYLLNYYSNEGSVIYRGKQYTNLLLRYNVYDQRVLLIYPYNDVEYKLHLQKEFINGFTIENKTFIKRAFGDSKEAKFYQVIGADSPIKLLYFWQKGLINVYANNSDNRMFSPVQKVTYILSNNELVSFKGNGSFTSKFPSKSKPAIKKYLRKNNTKVKHASDYEMELLIEFINTLAN
jgi:hypothetical protein